MSAYVLHPRVWEDLRELWEFIAEDNPDAADRVEEELFAAFELLAKQPGIGHSRPDITTGALRFWTVRRYLVAYDPDGDPLLVLMVVQRCAANEEDRRAARKPVTSQGLRP